MDHPASVAATEAAAISALMPAVDRLLFWLFIFVTLVPVSCLL
jgi:hypothetical protein